MTDYPINGEERNEIRFFNDKQIEILRFTSDGRVIANPDLKPDEIAAQVLEILKNLKAQAPK